MLSYSLSGYQATVRKYPYTLNEEGEKTYYDTMEATIAFDNVVLNEEDQEKSLFCRD